MKILENLIVGLDIGIGSVGWAVVEQTKDGFCMPPIGRNGFDIPAMGARAFNVPENAKDKKLKNVHRREMKRQRLTIKRRRQRMQVVRGLFLEQGLLLENDPKVFHLPVKENRIKQIDPWKARKNGLSRLLDDREFCAAFIHMAKHRGFQSNSKSDAAPGNTEDKKMLAAMEELREAFTASGAETVGAYLADKPKKRNRVGPDGKPVYSHTIPRSLLREEARMLFERQRQFGKSSATEELLDKYMEKAFEQRPLASRENLIGKCGFEPDQPRAPRRSYTAEKFILAQRLSILRLKSPGGSIRGLETSEILKVVGKLGSSKSITYKTLRKMLDLGGAEFEGLDYGSRNKQGKPVDVEGRDVVMRSGSCAEGSHVFFKLFGNEGFRSMVERRSEEGVRLIDAISWVMTVHDDLTEIARDLGTLPLRPPEKNLLMEAAENGAFAPFKQTARLSLKAMEAILPFMIEERDYDAGCRLAGYDPETAREIDLEAVRNPVVLRILREFRRQFKAIVTEIGGLPGRIHVELGRDIGKGSDERNDINRGIKRRTDEKNANREAFAEQAGKAVDRVSPMELMRYELWKEQQHKCAYHALWGKAGGERAYTGPNAEGAIPFKQLLDGPNAAQIDHILPRSRTFDNSFHNLCLCVTAANQAKGNRTPYEWIGREDRNAWNRHETWTRALRVKGLKKRNLLLKNLDQEVEGRFSRRNLTDTRYASRLVLAWLRHEYQEMGVENPDPDGEPRRRFFARSGSITYLLRRAWGVDALKKDAQGRRLGDRHHALDALVTALCSEGLLQRLTKEFQKMEVWKTKNVIVPSLPPPWPGFREDVEKALDMVFVSRAERGKESGAVHEDTLRQIRKETNEKGEIVDMVYERMPVSKLTEAKIERIKDAERNKDMVETLKAWLAKGKPLDKPPLSAKGDPIKRVRVRRGPMVSGIVVPRGDGHAQADNADMVRTDVFAKDGKYFLVPVYTHQLNAQKPPDRAVTLGKPEREWALMDDSFRFLFSLIPNCYVVTENRRGVVRQGYYSFMNRNTASITLAEASSHQIPIPSIGAKTLVRFEKYRVDRMGRLHLVKKEKRTWHGRVCTLAKPAASY